MYLTTNRRSAQPAPDVYSNLNRLSRLMDEALGFGWSGGSVASAWTPACDVFEDKENLKIVLELPGVGSDDVKISLDRILAGSGWMASAMARARSQATRLTP